MSEIIVTTKEELAALIEHTIESKIQSLVGLGAEQRKEIISQEELAKRLGVTVPTIVKYRSKGKIPFIVLGDRILYEFNEVITKLSKK